MSNTYARVELRNVKYSAFASEETHCFEATVYVDGKKAGTAHNEGHGGPTSFHPHSLQQTLDAYGKTFPADTSHGITIDIDGEIIVGELVNDWLLAKDLKRTLARKIVYTVASGAMYETKALPNLAAEVAKGEAHLRHKMRSFKEQPVLILNVLPFDAALAAYKRAAGA